MKKGQAVMVNNLLENRFDGKGTFLGITNEHGFKGHYRILNEHGHIMYVEPSRVQDDAHYWAERKRKHEKK